jgi:hypothetical protein
MMQVVAHGTELNPSGFRELDIAFNWKIIAWRLGGPVSGLGSMWLTGRSEGFQKNVPAFDA